MHKIISYRLKTSKEKVLHITTHLLCIIALLGISSFFFMEYLHRTTDQQIQESISQELIRFHVIANSDTKIDQDIKMIIKDKLSTALSPRLQQANTIEDARLIITNTLDALETMANETLQAYGLPYTATASLEKGYFPLKVYGDLSLPPGEYEAIRIQLGSATGQNWWCVMFPPVCFVDATYSYVPYESKEHLKYVLTEEEFDYIFEKKDTKVKIKFKLFDLLFGSKEKP